MVYNKKNLPKFEPFYVINVMFDYIKGTRWILFYFKHCLPFFMITCWDLPFKIDSEERQEKAEKEIKENIKIRKDIDLQKDGMDFLALIWKMLQSSLYNKITLRACLYTLGKWASPLSEISPH